MYYGQVFVVGSIACRLVGCDGAGKPRLKLQLYSGWFALALGAIDRSPVVEPIVVPPRDDGLTDMILAALYCSPKELN